MTIVELVEGDITHEQADAIVNAANSSLLGGGGVDGAIHQAGGPAILDECRGIRAERYPEGLPTGRAVVTSAGDLRATWVIHTVGPVYGNSSDPEADLTSCHVEALAVADQVGAKSVAFPAISTGVFGYPIYEAARVSLRAVRATQTEVERVRFVLFGMQVLNEFVDALRLLEHEASPARRVRERTMKSSRRTQPLPEGRARISYRRRFDAGEYQRLALGLRPMAMEDKWFIYLDDDSLYFHRSWTGVCIYTVRLRAAGRAWEVVEAWVNRASDQYRGVDDAYDAGVLSFLVERLLLGRKIAFPNKPSFVDLSVAVDFIASKLETGDHGAVADACVEERGAVRGLPTPREYRLDAIADVASLYTGRRCAPSTPEGPS